MFLQTYYVYRYNFLSFSCAKCPSNSGRLHVIVGNFLDYLMNPFLHNAVQMFQGGQHLGCLVFLTVWLLMLLPQQMMAKDVSLSTTAL